MCQLDDVRLVARLSTADNVGVDRNSNSIVRTGHDGIMETPVPAGAGTCDGGTFIITWMGTS
jgi:hypothetical protein